MRDGNQEGRWGAVACKLLYLEGWKLLNDEDKKFDIDKLLALPMRDGNIRIEGNIQYLQDTLLAYL